MRRFVGWPTSICLGLILVLAIFAVLLPSVFASKLAVVYSGSMAPAMPTGAIAVMQSVDPPRIKVGDIIAFKSPTDTKDIVSHRVIEVIRGETLSFRTKGDANKDPDPWQVPADNVVGRVLFDIPGLGYALHRIEHYTKGRLGFGLLICVPTGILIAGAVRDMLSLTSPRKKRARRLRQRAQRLERRWGHARAKQALGL